MEIEETPDRASSALFFIELRVHARIKSKHIPCRILEKSEPAYLWDFSFRMNYSAAQLSHFLQIGFDVIAVDIDQNVSGGAFIGHSRETTACAIACFPLGVIQCRIMLKLPA